MVIFVHDCQCVSAVVVFSDLSMDFDPKLVLGIDHVGFFRAFRTSSLGCISFYSPVSSLLVASSTPLGSIVVVSENFSIKLCVIFVSYGPSAGALDAESPKSKN